MLGKQISHYRIIEKLGEGGMGVVYKAEDTKLKRDVAIKCLPRQIAANAEERERFKIEAQAAAALNHPNIATIHTIEEQGDEMFIIMEYIEGQELREIVGAHRDAPMPVDQVTNYAIQIASGLQAAHKKGITHRDIKSSNIMITGEDQVKVMDFGLAKVHGGTQVTKIGTTLGTAAYMSPEQARGEEADHRSDIWSFGVVLYEMLTGQQPFKGDYEQAVIYSLINEEPEIPQEIPVDLQKILQKALAKDWADRYQNFEDILADLKSLDAEGTPVVSKPVEAGLKPASTKKLGILVGGVVILILIAALFIFQDGDQTIDSIAVLPLDNLSGDPAQEYFSDGMTEALITDLSKITALKVISRTSVMQFKNSDKSLPEIAAELGAKAVIEGSVMRDSNRVRITAQLIEAASDRHMWADSYERNLTDVFALQRDIAQAIAAEVKATLTPGEQAQLQNTKKIDPAAYEAYLKGIHHLARYTASDLSKGLDYFSQAVQLDPDFVLGYVGIVNTSMEMIDAGGPPFSELYPKAKSALDKALQLDDSLAEVYDSQGWFKFQAEWDWPGAEKAFRKSLELNPNLANAYWNYAILLLAMDRQDEALSMISKARSLDPLNPGLNNGVGWMNYVAQNYEEAIRELQNTLEKHPDFTLSHRILGLTYAMQSTFDEAIQSIQQAIALDSSPYYLSQLAWVYAMAGQRDKAHDILDEVLVSRETESFADDEIAAVYVALGDFDQAFERLEIGYQEHTGWPFFIKVEPRFIPLRSDPRFAPYLRRMGLEP